MKNIVFIMVLALGAYVVPGAFAQNHGEVGVLPISSGYHQLIPTTSEWEAGFPLMCIPTCNSKERCPTILRVILPRDLLFRVSEGQRDRQASAPRTYAC